MFQGANSFNQSLAKWDIRALEEALEMLTTEKRDQGMDCLNYSATLIGWANNAHIQLNVKLGAKQRFFNRTAKQAHTILIAKGWKIEIDELDPGCGGLSYIWVGTINDNFGTGGNWEDGVVAPKNGIVEFATVDNYGKEAMNNMVVNGDKEIGELINQTSKSTIIPAEKSLTVHGSVDGSSAKENAGRIIIKSAKDQPNGAFIVKGQPAGIPVYATVMM